MSLLLKPQSPQQLPEAGLRAERGEEERTACRHPPSLSVHGTGNRTPMRGSINGADQLLERLVSAEGCEEGVEVQDRPPLESRT